MPTVTHKRGDTFAPACAVKTGSTAQDITGWTIASQVRTQADQVVTALTVGARNDGAGTFALTAADGTTSWPVGPLLWDIQYTNAGVIVSTETITINCIRDITR